MVRWEGRVVTLLNLLAEGEQVHLIPIKRTLQRCHLEEEEDSLHEKNSWEEKEKSGQWMLNKNKFKIQWALPNAPNNTLTSVHTSTKAQKFPSIKPNPTFNSYNPLTL